MSKNNIGEEFIIIEKEEVLDKLSQFLLDEETRSLFENFVDKIFIAISKIDSIQDLWLSAPHKKALSNFLWLLSHLSYTNHFTLYRYKNGEVKKIVEAARDASKQISHFIRTNPEFEKEEYLKLAGHVS